MTRAWKMAGVAAAVVAWWWLVGLAVGWLFLNGGVR